MWQATIPTPIVIQSVLFVAIDMVGRFTQRLGAKLRDRTAILTALLLW